MKVPSFIGGSDEQRSTNLNDNKLVNLYPVTNNDGTVTGFYKVDGLKSEGTLSGVPTGAYKASNGRAFYTSGTTLYELTVVAGVYTSTSRGTITTASNYEFSDNGIELIMVNGIDGWLFTFSTNTLVKLTVLTGNFTVQTATAVDVDATLTKTSHGLIVGDRVILSTTGSLPANLLSSTPYYVLADSFTANSFKVGLTLTGATCTISNASPCVVTSTSHGFVAGDKIRFLTTGTLPASLAVGTIYYVLTDGLTPDTFKISLTSGGTAINTSTAGSGVHSFNPAITIIQTGLVDCTISIPKSTGTCTISNATPAVITKTAHGFANGDLVKFSTTGALPSPIIAGYNYVVQNASADTFNIASSTSLGLITINTTTAGSGTHTLTDSIQSVITTTVEHGLNPGDEVIFQTTGTLPTGITASSVYYVTGDMRVYAFGNVLIIGAGFVFTVSINKVLSESTPVVFYSNGVLPAAITAGKTYYLNVISAGCQFYTISEEIGGVPIYSADVGTGSCFAMQRDKFSISDTVAGIYSTPIYGTGTQSGTQSYNTNTSVAYGTHTYTTVGSGFPNGCKTVSYMDGRFIAIKPNTQYFYVSDVLDGKTWDAINVQTVDSNPDYVTGQIVSHNELFVFCENSGETYYDSGTTPTPFIRNQTGIFEAGCIAPYTIKEVDNSVFFLGNTSSGTGIVYRMVGLTPTRISTYSIEYSIQNMSDISDARAFTYQKDGHHYYVLTFPTGNKTFVYDANTNLWHERAKATYSISATPPSMSWTPSVSTITNFITKGIAWNGTVFCAVGTDSLSAATNVCYTSSDGIIWTQRAMPSLSAWFAISWNGTVFCAISYGSSIAATSTDGITWSGRTLPSSEQWDSIAWNGTVFCAVAGNTSNAATSPDGITWTTRSMPSVNNWVKISWNGTVFCSVVYNSTIAATSPDGITWTARTLSNSASWVGLEWNGTVFCLIATSSTVAATSIDGITWTAKTLPSNYVWSDIKSCNGIFCISNMTNNNTYISEDCITWTLVAVSGTTALIRQLCSDGSKFTFIGNTSQTTGIIEGVSSVPVVSAGSWAYTEWPVNKYLYFNNKHLVTDDTTTLYSIDSITYRNGTDPIRVVRSFRAPPSDMKRVRHNKIQIDCEVGLGATVEPVIALRWSDDAGNTWSTPIEQGLGLTTNHAQRVEFRRLAITKGLPRIYELSIDENVKITLLDCYLE